MKKLDKPNTFRGYFDNLENFSFYDLDSFLKIYEDYGIFLKDEFKLNNLIISQKQRPLLGRSPYKKNYEKNYKKSLTSNYNNWSDGIEFGILKKEDYLGFIDKNMAQNSFLFLNIPQEIFNFFEFMPNSNLGVIKYFINYIEKNSSWDDVYFVNNKIEELDEIIPDWNHNFPIFIYTTIKKQGLMMPLTNNWSSFLSGGIHRYVCQSLNNRPTPMFIQIPSKSYKNRRDFLRSFFIDDENFLFYSGYRLFVPRKDDHELCYLVFKINIETKIVELYLTPERNNEITEKFIYIGYIDYNNNTYEI